MERSQTRHDETESVDMPVNRSWNTGASKAMTPSGASLMTSIQTCSAGNVTRQALHLALSALQIDLAWHAGVVSAEAAMECLHHEVGEIVKRRDESTRADSPGEADIPQSPETPSGLRAQLR
jgi:hypothetical protein